MNTKKKVSNEFVESGVFLESDWLDLVNRISILFRLSLERKETFIQNKLSKLVAAIPYIANCEEPKRIALSHLTILFLAAHKSGKDVFNHNFSDNSSILKRLDRINHFEGGNKAIIERGMDLLSVIMLSDHIKDSIDDKKNNKYNPIESGVWNAQNQIERIVKRIKANHCEEMEKIINVEDAKATWWERT